MRVTLLLSYTILSFAVVNLVEGFGTVVMLEDFASMHPKDQKMGSRSSPPYQISPSSFLRLCPPASSRINLKLLVSDPSSYHKLVSKMMDRLASFLNGTSIRHPQPTIMPNLLDVIQMQPSPILQTNTGNRGRVEVGRGDEEDDLADTSDQDWHLQEKLRSQKCTRSSSLFPLVFKPRVG